MMPLTIQFHCVLGEPLVLIRLQLLSLHTPPQIASVQHQVLILGVEQLAQRAKDQDHQAAIQCYSHSLDYLQCLCSD
jgi:hypothetical protein